MKSDSPDLPPIDDVPLVTPADELDVDKDAVMDLMKRKFFFTQSFSIYGGVKGLYDYGPPGCAIKAAFINEWRKWFVIRENMLEIHGTALTPKRVFDVSGHVEKFNDLMVKDLESGNCYRADHLLEDALKEKIKTEKPDDATKDKYQTDIAKADDYSKEELGERLTAYGVKSPEGNGISAPFRFNLMFGTAIGPTSGLPGFMRPETAQGIFVNFAKLLEYNGGSIPFACAQVGLAFRNEISPRAGLLRVREFEQAEIEHFVHPDKKAHPSFSLVKDTKIYLFPRANQIVTKKLALISIGDAVKRGYVDNETLGYFIVRTHDFLVSCGIKKDKIRFRQHLENEMAHYAKDCWDCELLTSYGWVECVGIADRSAYDLTVHSAASGVRMQVMDKFDEPRLVETMTAKPNMKTIGKKFGRSSGDIKKYLASLSEDDVKALAKKLASGSAEIPVKGADGKNLSLTTDFVEIVNKKVKKSGDWYTPSVIEPSFGIGRCLYSIFEQTFTVRSDDAKKAYLSLPPKIASSSCAVYPLMVKDDLVVHADKIARDLAYAGVSYKSDKSGAAIGRKYIRGDELGIPFAVTVDYEGLESEVKTATLRERDSIKQIRVPFTEIIELVKNLVAGRVTWEEAFKKYPEQAVKA